MGYIKVDKNNTIPTDLRKAATDFKTMTSDLDTWINNNYNVSKSKLYKEEQYQEKNWVENLKEWVTKTVTRVVYDHRDAYEMYKQWLDKARSYNSSAKAIELKEAERLATAVEGMMLLIEQFDDIKNFDLAEGYSGNMNISTSDNGSTVTLYFKDADGNLIRISDLVNCFYTYSGMSMSGVVQGYLYAEANGLEFTAEYQQQILDGVNSTVGMINEAEGFGVVTQADLEGVSTALGFDYSAFVSNAQNTGGNWSNNMEVGSTILNQNYIMQEAFNFDPQNPTEVPVVEGPGITETPEDPPVGPPTDPPTDPTTETPNPGGPTGKDETDPSGPEETVPGQDDPTNPKNDDLDIELLDTGDVTGFEGMLPKMENDYDDLARQMFENMSDEELLAFREQSISRATTLIDNNDVEGIAAGLSGYGYSESDIGNFVDVNNGVIKNPDAVVAAYVAGDQNNYMAQMANNMAKNDGVTGFTSSHGSDASYSDHKSGKVNANIANMHDDEEVDEKSKQYQQAKNNYKQKADETNEAAEDANEALAEVKAKEKEFGSDTSKWTKEQADEYNEAKENYQEAKENYDQKVEEFNEAEKDYNDAREEYDQAKQDFENEVKENVKANEEFYENQPKDEANVDVSDDELIGEVTGDTGSDDGGNVGTGETQGNNGTDTGTTNTVDTNTAHEGTVNGDGTVSASDQGLLDAVGGSGDSGAPEGAGIAAGDTDGAGIATGGESVTAASETGGYENGLATGGDNGSATGIESTEPNNGIDDLRSEVETPDMETTGMESSTGFESTVGLESAPASESGIITEDNTSEMADITEFSEGLGSESAGTPEAVSENNVETSSEMTFDANDTDAAIAAQMAKEESVRNDKQKAEASEAVEVSTMPATSVQTASINNSNFRTSDGVLVESNGTENVVTVGNDAIMDSIRTE